MQHPYFHRRPPKSTGREEFGPQLLDRIVADARHMKIVDYDLVANRHRSYGTLDRRRVPPISFFREAASIS